MRACGRVTPLSVRKLSITNSWCSAACGGWTGACAAAGAAARATSRKRNGFTVAILITKRRESQLRSPSRCIRVHDDQRRARKARRAFESYDVTAAFESTTINAEPAKPAEQLLYS